MIELRSMAVAMPEVAGHPNRAAFRGVLTMVDVPSEQAPSGAKGHLVMLTKRAAEAALPSLLGMALDYSPSLDRHDVRRKVGVITRADVVGRNVEIGGYLFARDFPEIVKEIANSSASVGGDLRDSVHVIRKAMHAAVSPRAPGGWERRGVGGALEAVAGQLRRLAQTLMPASRGFHPTLRAESCMTAGAEGLGLSYEVTGVQVADPREQVWRLEAVTFTGAAILRRDKAAYRETWIELCS